MYHRFYPPLELRPKGNDIPTVALRDDRFLQHASCTLVRYKALHASHHALIGDLHFIVNLGKLLRSRIQHIAAIGDRFADPVDQSQSNGQGICQAGKVGGLFRHVFENPADPAGDNQGMFDFEQILWF